MSSTRGMFPSDANYKKNIEPIEDALEKIKQIQGLSFDWSDSAVEVYKQPLLPGRGVIAQDLEKIDPELVVKNAKGAKMVYYLGLIPYLIEAIKELAEKVEDK